MTALPLLAVATASRAVARVPSRIAKVTLIAKLLGAADPAEAAVVITWLSGELTQRQIGVGPSALRTLPDPAPQPSLTVSAVEQAFSELGAVGGIGSAGERQRRIGLLFGAATAVEQDFLRRLLTGDLRQGVLAGIATDAVARASGIGLAEVRRAVMVAGIRPVAVTALGALSAAEGSSALAGFRLQVGRGVSPMLASTAADVGAALRRLDAAAVIDYKLDGIRIQVHRSGPDVAIFTRSLDDITTRLPEICDVVRALPADGLVLDGEVLAIEPDGRPSRFQTTASRVGNSRRRAGEQALSPFFFDILAVDGTDLLATPLSVRSQLLAAHVPVEARVPRLITADADAADAFLQQALDAGHEGVVVKALESGYEAGRRGASWLKVKPVHTLDLVVLAVEWGSGRRKGLLSNLHLGARDEQPGQFVMLGKTFKGMTDELLRWQTQRFLALATGPTDQWTVPVRPEQVVEIAFDGVQLSSVYPGGVTLRFARVLRYRDDKTADEADTIATVRAFADRTS